MSVLIQGDLVQTPSTVSSIQGTLTVELPRWIPNLLGDLRYFLVAERAEDSHPPSGRSKELRKMKGSKDPGT